MTYVKIGGIALLVLALFFGGFYLGGLKSKVTLEHSLSQQSATVAAALQAQQKISDAEETRLNGIIAKYEQTPIDPIALTLGASLHKYTLSECPVSGPAANSSGTGSTPAVTASDGSVERATDAVFKACAQDAAELAAIQQAWPK